MLGKLLKHEFKHTGRYILWMFIALFIVTPVSALYTKFYSDTIMYYYEEPNIIFSIIQSFLSTIYILTIIAVSATTAILLMYRFYKSMISSEGYLTHTLPVSTTSIIFSKIFIL